MIEKKIANPKKQVFQLQFAIGEFDMVVADKINAICEIYEVKHTKEQAKEQYRHLIDEEKLKKTEFRYGKITKRVVTYYEEDITSKNHSVRFWNYLWKSTKLFFKHSGHGRIAFG